MTKEDTVIHTVTFYPENSGLSLKTIETRNLNWVTDNMKYIEVVTLEEPLVENSAATLSIVGNRNGQVFYGFFHFAEKKVLREWAAKRRHFQTIGVNDVMG